MVNQLNIAVKDLLAQLKAANVKLWVENGRLQSKAPAGAITPFLRSQIKFHKETIIQLIQETQKKAAKTATPSIPKIASQDSYALSHAQRRLWVLEQMGTAENAYNLPAAIRVEGTLNIAALEQALTQLVERHESLRTNFVLENGQARQIIRPVQSFNLSISRWENPNPAALETYIQAHANQGFDLTKDSPLKVELVQLSDNTSILLFNMHHIISDGWSMDILYRELSALYQAVDTGKPANLTPLRIQYKAYVAWQHQLLSDSEKMADLRTYWMEQLADLTTLELPTDALRPAIKTYGGAELSHTFNQQILTGLKGLSKAGEATLFMTLTALTKVLLYRYSGQEDIILGTPSAGRNHPDLHDQIGYYVNTVVLRDQLQPNASFNTTLQTIKQTALAAFERELYPFDQLVEELNLDRDMSRSPIFDVMVVLQNNEQGELTLGETKLNFLPSLFNRSKFDLTFGFVEVAEGLQVNIEYNTDLFKEATITRMVQHLETLIKNVLVNPKVEIGQVAILPKTEKDLLLHTFNDTKRDYPTDKTIIDLFEEQVEKTPDNIALIFENTELTYRQLNERANRVGHYLSETYDIQPDDIIALQLERSEWMMIGILGILKAGAAYLPIAPDVPKARTEYMLQDSQAKVLLTDEGTYERAKELDVPIAIGIEIVKQIKGSKQTNFETRSKPKDLVYIIYTSGSTGQPKGVMVKHQGFFNLMQWYLNDFTFSENSRFLLVSSITFDLTQKNMFAPLSLGGRLYLSQSENYDIYTLTKIIETNGITNINCTPTIFYGIVDLAKANQYAALQTLRYVFLGGESINFPQLKPWYDNPYNQAKLVNSYGPTECSDVVSYYQLENNEVETIPIGAPICNTQLHLLDKNNNLVPIGVTGELCIAGKGVSRGYLNNPKLTAEKFISNPFKQGELLYKTGDLARWLPDGNIDFLGRVDHQLKVRGYRIETGEIEQNLLEHAAIQAAVVVGYKPAGQATELAAYLVAAPNAVLPAIEELRNHLVQSLPNYMVPAYFVELDSLPLTISGKINRKALPEPQAAQLASGTEYVAPQNHTETTLAHIWESLLQRESIGIHDNFFDLGGHSLRAIRLVALVKQQLQVDIKLSTIFAQPTIASLATFITGEEATSFAAIEPIAIQDDYELSHAQRRLWVLDQLETGQNAYNIPEAIRITGALNTAALEQALTQFFERHESLRTNFVLVDGKPRQIIRPAEPYQLKISDWKNADPTDLSTYIHTDAHEAFDLSKDALLKIELLQLGDNDCILLFNMHHIISDGWSMEVLFKELSLLYQAADTGEAANLPPLKIQYKDYAAWQNQLLSDNEAMADLRTYWTEQLANLTTLELPTDFPRPSVKTYQGAHLRIKFSDDLLPQLEAVSRANGATLFMTLTTLLKVLIYRYSGQEDIILGTPSAGRNHPDLHDQIGYYINTVVLRDQLAASDSFTDTLLKVKQTALAAFERELYPFDQLVEELELDRDMSRSPIFDVMLILQNNEQSELKFGETELSILPSPFEVSKFDLTFNFVQETDGLNLDIEYNTDLFKEETIARMGQHLETLMANALANQSVAIGEIDILPKAERALILDAFNDTKSDFPTDKTIIDLFEEQVEKTPDAIAVVFEDRQLTYKELNEQTNRIGAYLRTTYHIESDDIIALQLERSEWMLIAVLGVMKAGGAYLPIAPDTPKARTEYMVKDSQAKVLLTDAVTFDTCSQLDTDAVVENVQTIEYQRTNRPPLTTHRPPSSLAYIIYTSGSTGRPKGVMIEHQALMNFLLSMQKAPGLQQQDTLLSITNYTFDISILEFGLPLIIGAQLVIASSLEQKDMVALKALIKKTKPTFLQATPSLWSILLSHDKESFHQMKLLCGGEALPEQLAESLLKAGDTVWNMYGPTETTIWSSILKLADNQRISIGQPIANTDLYILDKDLTIQPIGIVGELHIGGAGLARGYLNNRELTAQKFIPHPFIEGERLYKTGDLARWLSDGNIEFLGRVDHQLKVRGYRIEAGEIEAALLEQDAIQNAVVVGYKQEGQATELVAYLVANPTATIPAIEALHNHLSESLPDYMIPAYFVELEALPLTSSGKVNRKALPAPQTAQLASGTAYVAPRNEKESILLDSWKAVLRRDIISIHDNFFHIGGDSIKAIQITARLAKYDLSLSIKDLFTHPTIAGLATLVQQKNKQYDQGVQQGTVPLTAVQRWAFEDFRIGEYYFNQAMRFSTDERLDSTVLRKSLQQVLVHHDILRSTFDQQDGDWVQTIQPHCEVELQVEDLRLAGYSETKVAKLATSLQASIDLAAGPLVKALLVQTPTGDELILIIHHLVVDGVSWRILLEDLDHAYTQIKSGQSIRLPEKTASFGLWAAAVQDYATAEESLQQTSFWQKQLQGAALSFVDDSQPNLAKYADALSFELSKEQTNTLLQQVNQAYQTEINEVLLTALSRALQATFGASAYGITLEGHGREDMLDLDISRTVGWFTSMFPIVLEYKESLDFHLQSIKENLRRIPHKGVGYGILKYLSEADLAADNAAIVFNYLGDFSAEQAKGRFNLSPKTTGASIHPEAIRQHELEVAGIIVDGKLNLSIAYPTLRMESDLIQQFLDNYQTALLELMEHCSQQSSSIPSPVDFTACDLSLEEYQEFVERAGLSTDQIADIYPLSPLQEGMLFHRMMSPESEAYFTQMDIGLGENLDVKALKQAWQQVVQRHTIFRTSFHSEGLDRSLQVVKKEVALNWREEDLSHLPIKEQQTRIAEFLIADRQEGFDLQADSLLRIALFKESQQYRLVVSNHHIISDGWSMPIIFDDLMLAYKGKALAGELPYAPFIAWLEKKDKKKQEAFWKDYLSGYETASQIPLLEQAEQTDKEGQAADYTIKLTQAQTQDLSQLAAKAGVSLNTVLQAIWSILLARYNGYTQEKTDTAAGQEVVFGMTTSGRSAPIADIEQQTGLFINTIPVRVKIDPNGSFVDLLGDIHQESIALKEHEHYPLASIQNLWEGAGDLFDHILVFENYPYEENVEINETDLPITHFESRESIHYGFGLLIIPGKELNIKLTYQTNQISTDAVERMGAHVQTLIQEVLAQPQATVQALNILPTAEKQLVTHAFNDTKTDFPNDKTVIHFFEEQVKKTPEAIALSFEDKQWTYQALNQQVNQIAHHLIDNYQIQPNQVIALLPERTAWMPIGILAILKTGAAYLPLDKDLPKARLTYMLENSDAKLLLSDKANQELAQQVFSKVLLLEEISATNPQLETRNPQLETRNSNHLAYILYTSGSTGQPKGVLMPHQPLMNLVHWQVRTSPCQVGSRTPQSTAFSFDVSFQEIFSTWLSGGELVMMNEAVKKDLFAFAQFVATEKIERLFLPFAALQELAQLLLNQEEDISALKEIITAGEQLQISDALVQLFNRLPNCILKNQYGPTESHVVSEYVLQGNPSTWQALPPIGIPIVNTQLYILSAALAEVPIGVIGELYIGGVCLANGYLSLEELTAEKFIPHPFKSGERLYRTGDLARWLPDGNIEFLGRADHQLKVRGYRIETGEIEQVLVAHPAITTAAVVGYKQEGKATELAAYLVTKPDATIPTIKDLHSHLSEMLPDYMIPAYFVELEAFPLTTSGKINRRALPAPETAQLDSGTAYVASRNEKENILVNIWKAVLRRDIISIHDNFFHIGGDSIKAIQITARLAKYDLSLSIRDLFIHPTIAGLAKLVQQKTRKYDQGIQQGIVPLTAIQRWGFEDFRFGEYYYNQAMRFSSAERLDSTVLRKSLEQILLHHDMLRATFEQQDGRWVQTIQPHCEVVLQVEDLSLAGYSEAKIEELATPIQASLDLAAGPLFKTLLVRTPTGDELILIIHHLVMDGISQRIITEDLEYAYTQLMAGHSVRLPEKTAPFALWSKAIQDYATSTEGLQQIGFWQKQLQGANLSLVDNSQPNLAQYADEFSFELSEEQTTALIQQVNRAYQTEINEVLLTALSRTLKTTFGESVYSITLEGHGREDILDLDISRTVGWFTSLFPISLEYEASLGFHLQSIKENLRRIPHKGVGYGILKYISDADLAADNTAISFNYLGDFGTGTGVAQAKSRFNLSPKTKGVPIHPQAIRQYELEVMGIIVDGKLNIYFIYPTLRMKPALIQQLLDNYQTALLELSHHCSQQAVTIPSPADFTACDLNLSEYQQFLEKTGLSAEQITDIYPLSPLQEGMLFHRMMHPESEAYFIQMDIGLSKDLDTQALKEAWQEVVNRHAIFRTSFYNQGLDRPLQVVKKEVELNWYEEDLGHLFPDEQQRRIADFLRADRRQGFDLQADSLLRLTLFKTSHQYQLIVSNHHISMDGWSMPIILDDLILAYEGKALAGELTYAPFIAWLEKKDKEKEEAFWKDYLSGYETASRIPFLEETDKEGQAGEYNVNLNQEQTQALSQLAAKAGVSLNTVVQAIWGILLAKYNEQATDASASEQEVVFGMTTSGRSVPIANIEQQTGLFINTIPVRIKIDPNGSFVDLLGDIHQESIVLKDHEHYSLASIQSLWEGTGNLFDHILVFENYPLEESVAADKEGLPITHLEVNQSIHYGFGLLIIPGEELSIQLTYQTSQISIEAVKRMGAHLQTLIQNVLAQPQAAVQALNILPEAEKQLITHTFNDTKADYPHDKTIIDVFEEQAERTPNNIAVVFEGKELTYQQLNEAANKVGHYLKETYHIQPEDIIALQLERSEWMVIALLGIMKAGGAYLPISPDTPKARTEFMLADSQAKVLLTDAATFDTASQLDTGAVVENIQAIEYQITNRQPLTVNRQPSNLAYIIYTSGSTGQPKGVTVEHQGVVNILNWMQKAYPLTEKDCLLQQTTYTFDVSVIELFWWSLVGARLYILPSKAEKDPVKIWKEIEQNQVTTMHLVPSLLQVLLAVKEANPNIKEGMLRQIFVAGEALQLHHLHKFNELIGVNGQTKLHNVYGPTEASIYVSYYNCDEFTDLASVPIGKPIDNIELHILDKQLEVVGIGIIGDLYISGAGLARGYLNNPTLTAEKFIPHPFKQGERLYQTGDLARWFPDGNIEFLGRIDHQLKVRGYRIEAGEIEEALLAHDTIQTAVVIGYNQNGQGTELVAYLVPNSNAVLPTIEDLRSHLAQSLPDYMIPAYFVELETLPLTTSGKVNRKALPEPQTAQIALGTTYVAPRNEMEATLADIWQTLLNREKVGIHDNFFEIGGHSLRAIRLVSLVQQSLNVAIKLSDVFTHPTIAALGEAIAPFLAMAKLKNLENNHEKIENLEEWEI